MLCFEPIPIAGTCGAVAHESIIYTRNTFSAEMTDSCYSSASQFIWSGGLSVTFFVNIIAY